MTENNKKIPVIIIGIVIGEYHSITFSPSSVFASLYLVFIASILGYCAYIYAISKLPVSFVSTHSYINPLIALILGWFLLDEKVTIHIGFAAVLIITGVMLVRKGSQNVENE